MDLVTWEVGKGKLGMAAAELSGLREASDEVLVEAIVAGDQGSFDLLYERYFPRVYRFLDRRLNNRADVEEVVQEVFINVFNSLAGYRGDAPFAAWVFGLTRRTLAARFKRRRAETVPLADDDSERPIADRNEPDPHLQYEASERLARLRSAVEQDLSPEQWELFRLHHLENRSIQDIAQRHAKSEDAVKSHLYRARKLLLAR